MPESAFGTSDPRTQPTVAHRVKVSYLLFSDAYSAHCACGWHASACTDRARIRRLAREHEGDSAL